MLARLRGLGVAIVGYSAASSANLAKRIRMLDLEQYFDFIFAARFDAKSFPGESKFGESSLRSRIIELPGPKSDGRGAARIISKLHLPADSFLFIGDSIVSDVLPPNRLGARVALVKRHNSEEHQLISDLLRVSHLSLDSPEVRKETPKNFETFPILESLDEIFDLFSFAAYRNEL